MFEDYNDSLIPFKLLFQMNKKALASGLLNKQVSLTIDEIMSGRSFKSKTNALKKTTEDFSKLLSTELSCKHFGNFEIGCIITEYSYCHSSKTFVFTYSDMYFYILHEWGNLFADI